MLRNQFLRNVAVVASGTAAAQAINVAFSPFITRIYTPEAFGAMGTFMALASVLTPVAAFSYPIAIILPKEDDDAKGIACLSIITALGTTAFITILILTTGDKLIELLHAQEIGCYLWAIPITILSDSIYQIIQQWMIRKNNYILTARLVTLQSFIIGFLKIAIGLFYSDASVLIILTAVSNALYPALLISKIKNQLKKIKKTSYPIASLKKLAKQYYDFPLYRSPQILINASSQSLPVLMLVTLFGPQAAGFYTLGKSVMGIPSTLIGKSVGDVFYPRITEAAYDGENITKLILKATLALAAIGFIPFSLVGAFGPELFKFFFGPEWHMAGVYARWISLMLFFNFINRPAVAAIPILNLNKKILIYELFSTVSKMASLYIGFFIFKNDVISIAIFSITGATAYVILIILIIKSSGKLENTRNKK